jgi:predicted extracellular nuclease
VEAASGGSRHARVLFGGDLNVFPRPDDPFAPGDPLFPSDQLGPLYDEAGLENLWDELRREVPASAYTYVFEGQAQTLDHQFVSRQLERDLERVRVAHINADWPADFAADGARGASDHDPVVSRFEFPSGRGHGKGKGHDDD